MRSLPVASTPPPSPARFRGLMTRSCSYTGSQRLARLYTPPRRADANQTGAVSSVLTVGLRILRACRRPGCARVLLAPRGAFLRAWVPGIALLVLVRMLLPIGRASGVVVWPRALIGAALVCIAGIRGALSSDLVIGARALIGAGLHVASCI